MVRVSIISRKIVFFISETREDFKYAKRISRVELSN